MKGQDNIARWELFWAIKLGQIKAEDCFVNYEKIHDIGLEEVREQVESRTTDFEVIWSRHYHSLRKRTERANAFATVFPAPISELVDNAGLDHGSKLSDFRDSIISKDRKNIENRLASKMLTSIYDWDNDEIMSGLKIESAIRYVFRRTSVASPFDRVPKWYPEVYLSAEKSDSNVMDAIASLQKQDKLGVGAELYHDVLEPHWDKNDRNLLHYFFGEYDCLDRTLIIYLDRIHALEKRMKQVGDEVLDFIFEEILQIALSLGYGYWVAQDIGLIPSLIYRELDQWHHLWMLGFATQIIEFFGDISWFWGEIIPSISHTYSALIVRNPKVLSPSLKYSGYRQHYNFLYEIPDFTTMMNTDEDYSKKFETACAGQKFLNMPEPMNLFLFEAGMKPAKEYKMESFQSG